MLLLWWWWPSLRFLPLRVRHDERVVAVERATLAWKEKSRDPLEVPDVHGTRRRSRAGTCNREHAIKDLGSTCAAVSRTDSRDQSHSARAHTYSSSWAATRGGPMSCNRQPRRGASRTPVTRGRSTRGRLTRGRLTRGQLTRGRSTRGHGGLHEPPRTRTNTRLARKPGDCVDSLSKLLPTTLLLLKTHLAREERERVDPLSELLDHPKYSRVSTARHRRPHHRVEPFWPERTCVNKFVSKSRLVTYLPCLTHAV